MITKTNKAFPKERLYFNFSEFSQVQLSPKLNAVFRHKKNLSAQRDFWCPGELGRKKQPSLIFSEPIVEMLMS